jgi:hypothetical protein
MGSDHHAYRRWMSVVLYAAAAYNVLWGLTVILLPSFLFELARMAPPNYPELWQCIGMMVGVYGLGYAVAAANPRRHWPIVLVGLLGKILGPIGFLHAAWQGRLPWVAGLTILANDVAWWLPFALILDVVRREAASTRRRPLAVSQTAATLQVPQASVTSGRRP